MKSKIRNLAKESLQRFVFPEKFIWRRNRHSGTGICLSFDDGPNPAYTREILDLLDKYKINALFFLVGENVTTYPDIANEIVQRGHYVGGHTFLHKNIVDMKKTELAEDLLKTKQAIEKATGIQTNLFRPPRGLFKLANLKLSSRLGYTMVHWTKTYSDYLQDGKSELVQRMSDNPPAPRDIILLHDNNRHTISALDKMLKQWINQGYKFSPEP